MSKEQQAALYGNTARALGDAPREIKIRHIGHCLKADPAHGKAVAEALGIPLSEIPEVGLASGLRAWPSPDAWSLLHR